MKKLTVGKLSKLLWIECRRIADFLFVSKDGKYYCFTCGCHIEGGNKQLGHFIPSSVCGAFLRFDVYRNLRWQCMRCNVHAGGNGAIYYENLVKENGQEYVDQIMKDKQKSVKAYDFYVELLAKYRDVC